VTEAPAFGHTRRGIKLLISGGIDGFELARRARTLPSRPSSASDV